MSGGSVPSSTEAKRDKAHGKLVPIPPIVEEALKQHTVASTEATREALRQADLLEHTVASSPQLTEPEIEALLVKYRCVQLDEPTARNQKCAAEIRINMRALIREIWKKAKEGSRDANY